MPVAGVALGIAQGTRETVGSTAIDQARAVLPHWVTWGSLLIHVPFAFFLSWLCALDAVKLLLWPVRGGQPTPEEGKQIHWALRIQGIWVCAMVAAIAGMVLKENSGPFSRASSVVL